MANMQRLSSILFALLALSAAAVPAAAQAVTVRVVQPVYAEGDSLTLNGGWPARLALLLGPDWPVVVRGVPGRTAAQIALDINTDVIKWNDARVAVVFAGVNDAAMGLSAASIKTALQATYSALDAAGISVLAVEILPWKGTGTWNAETQAVTVDVNAWMLTATGIDGVVLAYVPMGNPADPAALLPLYDSGDHTHLSPEGNEKLGDLVYAAWPTLAAPTVPEIRIATTGTIGGQDIRPSADPYWHSVGGDAVYVGAATRLSSHPNFSVVSNGVSPRGGGWGFYNILKPVDGENAIGLSHSWRFDLCPGCYHPMVVADYCGGTVFQGTGTVGDIFCRLNVPPSGGTPLGKRYAEGNLGNVWDQGSFYFGFTPRLVTSILQPVGFSGACPSTYLEDVMGTLRFLIRLADCDGVGTDLTITMPEPFGIAVTCAAVSYDSGLAHRYAAWGMNATQISFRQLSQATGSPLPMVSNERLIVTC